MLYDPIGQGLLETNVSTGFLRFDPFVFENLLPLGLKLAVKGRILNKSLQWASLSCR